MTQRKAFYLDLQVIPSLNLKIIFEFVGMRLQSGINYALIKTAFYVVYHAYLVEHRV